MKTWLKGGLIGSIVGLIVALIPYLSESVFNIDLSIFIFPMFLTSWFFCGENNIGCAWTVIFISSIVGLFLIGALIGLIFGKSKE